MPMSGLNIGRDARFDIYTSNGPLTLPTLLKFSAKKLNKQVTVKPLAGLPIHLNFMEDGWKGSFEVSRADSTLDDYFAGIEAGYYAGTILNAGTIQQTISEIDGTVSTYQYQGVVLYFEDEGDYEAEKNVIQKVEFLATTRVKLS